MNDQHRIVREGVVQVSARRLLILCHHVFVVAVADDQFTRLDAPVQRKFPQRGDNFRHVARRADWWGGDVGPIGHRERIHEMAVAVDKARHQCPAAQVDERRLVAPVGFFNIGPRTDREYLVVLYSQRFRRGLGVVQGDDVATRVNRVSGIFDLGIAAGAGERQGGHSGQNQFQIQVRSSRGCRLWHVRHSYCISNG